MGKIRRRPAAARSRSQVRRLKKKPAKAPSEETMRYVEWLKSGLALPGKTKTGLARAMNVGAYTVSRMLGGGRELKPKELLSASEYFEKPHPDLWGDTPMESTPYDEELKAIDEAIDKQRIKRNFVVELIHAHLARRKEKKGE